MTGDAGLHGGLVLRLNQTMADLDHVIRRISGQLERARATGDDGYFDAVALNLHSFYNGIERCFEAIARRMDGGLPTGPEWHYELLLQMAAEIEAVRPRVIQPETRACLDDYRRFRHAVRHIYAFNLDPQRVATLADNLVGCFARIRHDLEAFVAFLIALDASD